MRRFIPWQTKTLALILGLLGLIAVACGSAATATPRPTATPVPTAAPTPTAEVIVMTGSGIQGGDPDFDLTAMVWQGYWLSRDQFGPFVMASGMGVTFMPPMDMMQMAMQMVAQNPDDAVMVPQNMVPLQAVFAHELLHGVLALHLGEHGYHHPHESLLSTEFAVWLAEVTAGEVVCPLALLAHRLGLATDRD